MAFNFYSVAYSTEGLQIISHTVKYIFPPGLVKFLPCEHKDLNLTPGSQG